MILFCNLCDKYEYFVKKNINNYELERNFGGALKNMLFLQ
jgi:hypothetical protein